MNVQYFVSGIVSTLALVFCITLGATVSQNIGRIKKLEQEVLPQCCPCGCDCPYVIPPSPVCY